MKRPRVVIDSNVIVSAMRSRRGMSYALLMRVGLARFDLCLSVPLILEYEKAIAQNRTAIPLADADIGGILDYLCSAAEHRKIHYLWRPFLRDPKDDMVLELAFAAGCDYIVTFNTSDFVGSAQLGVAAITPGPFLKILGEST